jgi:uncharacterized metal-binding protein YceD (DUF177 family)
VDNLFERKYSVELSKLLFGLNEEVFKIDRSFFTEFELSQIEDGDVDVKVSITKHTSHLDVTIAFEGRVMLPCDRCLEPWPYDLKVEERVIFTTDSEMEFDFDEVVVIEDSVNWLPLYTEFFDFMHIHLPIRKVPPAEVHLCPPAVLEILGLDAQGNESDSYRIERKPEEDQAEEDEVIDPRWAALKKLKNKEE